MKPILIVQHDAEAGPGHFERYLNDNALAFTTVRVFAGETMPKSAAAYAGICSLGGAMSANDDLQWIGEELKLMRDADSSAVPVIGHCLGGQLLAKAFGATVSTSPITEIGWGEVEVDDVELARRWTGEGAAFEVFQWHEDAFGVPGDGRRFLTNAFCPNQAFSIERDGFAHLGMQFHVEMTPQLVRSWTDSGNDEIDRALERQKGKGVQRADQMLHDVGLRTSRMHQLADRIYERWISGVRR